ncbi:hypothetical protein QYE76_047505 [Lolium multiflorum]|uniref:Uncharacterized protein n=1 Tax=Lolium multiflorum TaxID=4521 RepID=A0AAD8WZD3_LOLMU|nr:hypothetical protein QYE76_047505 [Lolium multiflorum]
MGLDGSLFFYRWARALPSDAESRLYTVVDMRARLSPPLPSAYFGNAGVRTSVSAKVGDVLASPLKFGAQRLRMAHTDLRVISWMGMASHDANFGWGEPAVVAPAAVSYTWFVYSVGDSGDVAVAVAMKPDQLERFCLYSSCMHVCIQRYMYSLSSVDA